MSSHLTIDSLTMMNNALNRELQRLGEDYLYDSVIKGKRLLSNMASPSSHFRNTHTVSTLSLNSAKNSSVQRLNSPINFYDSQNIDKEEATNKGLRMQKELIGLHTKVLSLEKKVHLIDARTPTKRSIQNPLSTTRKNSSRKKSAAKHIEERRSPCRYEERDITAYNTLRHVEKSISPIKSPVYNSTRSNSKRNATSVTKRKIFDFSCEKTKRKSSEKTKRKSREPPSAKKQRTGSPSILKSSEFRVYSPVKGDSAISKVRNHEHAILNGQIMKLKKEYNEDQLLLKSERIKGEELAKEIERIEQKAERLQRNIDRFSKMGSEMRKLESAFGKSEEIRKQQKNMIGNLNYELTLLKAERENFALKSCSKNEKEKIHYGERSNTPHFKSYKGL